MKQPITLDVQGMSCGGCVRSVRKIIADTLELPPECVEVDLDAARATFSGDTDQLDELVTRLEKQGFSASPHSS